jgi:hypothetical protein
LYLSEDQDSSSYHFLEAFQPCEQSSLQGHHEVDDLGWFGAACDIYGRRVAPEPLLRSLLAVVFSMPIGLKPFGYWYRLNQRWYLMDAIEHDSMAVYQEYGEEEARAADSFLNMSRDGITEEDDDDFALRHEQPVPNENPVGVRILCIYAYKNSIYILY